MPGKIKGEGSLDKFFPSLLEQDLELLIICGGRRITQVSRV